MAGSGTGSTSLVVVVVVIDQPTRSSSWSRFRVVLDVPQPLLAVRRTRKFASLKSLRPQACAPQSLVVELLPSM